MPLRRKALSARILSTHSTQLNEHLSTQVLKTPQCPHLSSHYCILVRRLKEPKTWLNFSPYTGLDIARKCYAYGKLDRPEYTHDHHLILFEDRKILTAPITIPCMTRYRLYPKIKCFRHISVSLNALL